MASPRAGAWWNWKDEKTALECLVLAGELMVARRQNFQRVYDLRSRILPGWDDGPELANVPGREEVQQLLALRAVQALGVARAAWVPDYYRQYKTGNTQRLEALAEAGSLRRVQIESLPGPAYLDPLAPAPEAQNFTSVLSPFDPIVWDRQRLKELHNFDYTIEVLHSRRQTQLRILHPAHPAQRQDRGAAGPQSPPQAGCVRGQSHRPGAGGEGDRRAGGGAAGLPAAPGEPGTARRSW